MRRSPIRTPILPWLGSAGDLAQQLATERSQLELLRNSLNASERNQATLAAQYEAAEQKCVEQKKLLDDAQEKLREAFACRPPKCMAKNNEAFLQLAKEKFATLSTEAAGSLDERKAQIEGMLKPMQEILTQYQTRLGEIEKSAR